MGICSSCEITNSIVTTIKVVLEDGRLEEYSPPIRVSQIIERTPNCFVCNADDMDFDDYVFAIDDNEELQLGKLYFLLPLNWLDSPLRANEMASLAVKASFALKSKKCGSGKGVSCCGGRKREVSVLEESPILADKDSHGDGLVVKRRVTSCGGGGGGAGRWGRGCQSRRKLSITTNLNVIEEEEEEEWAAM